MVASDGRLVRCSTMTISDRGPFRPPYFHHERHISLATAVETGSGVRFRRLPLAGAARQNLSCPSVRRGGCDLGGDNLRPSCDEQRTWLRMSYFAASAWRKTGCMPLLRL